MAQESKFYAVKKGRKTGVFKTWAECSDAVHGFSGAQYKSFKTEKEALAYLSDSQNSVPIYNKDTLIAYVDGSFDVNTNRYGSGVVIFFQDKTYEFNNAGNSPDLIEMRNVAGEITGAVMAIKFAIKQKAKNIVIFYDYAGIEEWAEGNWKANKAGTQKYKAFIDSARPYINIGFEKVKAHTGDTFNERADILAKNALGLVATEVKTPVTKEKPKLELSEKAKVFAKEHSGFCAGVDAYIKENNIFEKLDVVDMFFEDNTEDFIQNNEEVVMEIVQSIYEYNAKQGIIKIV